MSQLTTSLILTGDARALTAALQRGETGLDGFNQAVRNTGQGMKSARDSATAFEAGLTSQRNALNQTRAMLDPVYRSSKQYEAVLSEVQRAVANGTASQAEANRMMALAEAQYLATGRSAQVMSGSTRVAAGSLGNIAAQGNDILVMLAAGQNPIQLALQQGTQLNQVFATMGGGATVLRSIGAAAMSMVSPVSLATLGIIAGGAALVQWGASALSAEEETDALSDAIDELNEKATDAATKVRLFLSGADSEAELTVLEKVKELNAEISIAQATADQRGGHTGRAANLRAERLIAERDTLLEIVATGKTQIAQAEHLDRIQQQANQAGANYVARLEAEKAAAEEAERLIAAYQDQAALQLMIAQFGEDSAAVARLRVQQERELFVEQTNSRDITEELKDELIASWDAANGMASVEMAANIAAAANEASRMANELNRAVNSAIALANQGVGGADRARINYEFRDDSTGRAAALARAEFDARTSIPAGADSTITNVIEAERREFVKARVDAAQYTEQLQKWQAENRKANRASASGGASGGRRGGGRTGASEQERTIQQIEREISRLAPSYEGDIAALDKWRAEALATLDPVAAGYEAFSNDVATIYDLKLADAYQRDLERRDDWAAGVERGFKSINDDMLSWANAGENIVTEWSTGLEDQFFNLAKNGKASVTNLIDYTLEQFLRLQYQQTIQPGVEAGFGFLTDIVGGLIGGIGGGGGSGATVTQSHAGSQIGTGGVRRTYGTGAPLRADERLTVTTLGQRVFTPEQIANGATVVDALAKAAQGTSGGSGATVFAPTISIDNRGSTPVRGEMQEETGANGQRSYKLVLADEVGSAINQPGGGAQKALRQGYGVRPKGTRR